METFLVRIWTEGEEFGGVDAVEQAGAELAEPGAGAPSLLGIVRHVRTGSEWRFADAGELAAILGAASRPGAPAGTSRGAVRGPSSRRS